MNPLASNCIPRREPASTKLSRFQKKQRDAAQRKLVDEYGRLTTLLLPFKQAISRVGEVAKELRKLHAAADPATPIELDGNHYRVTLGARGMQTVIPDLEAVYQALGHERFMAACSVTLTSLTAALAEAQQPSVCLSSFTENTQTGSRAISVVSIL